MKQELERLDLESDLEDEELMKALFKLDRTLDDLESCMDDLEKEFVHKDK